MGVIHKLRPEVKEFIIEKKRSDPSLSCRTATSLVLEKFQFKLSKSSANSIFKEIGLSLPVGRRKSAAKTMPSQPVYSGEIFLKAADSMLGGSACINGIIGRASSGKDILLKTKALFEGRILKNILGRQDNAVQTSGGSLSFSSAVLTEIAQALKGLCCQAHCVKVDFGAGKELYLDGQMYTLWPSQKLPASFSSPVHNLENRINSHFKHNQPFVLFFAPGYKHPGADLFAFIRSFSGSGKNNAELTFYDNCSQETKKIKTEVSGPRQLIFGVWPWQFKECIKINKQREFEKFDLAPLGKVFYIAETEIELFEPGAKEIINLKGCLLKNDLNEKTGLLILSTPAETMALPQVLAQAYLEYWPNPVDSFQNFSRSVEAFSREKGKPAPAVPYDLKCEFSGQTIEALLDNYVQLLELCVRSYFLPAKYLSEEFTAIKNRFYLLRPSLKKVKNNIIVNFDLAADDPLFKDIEYISNRANEKQWVLGGARKFWLKAPGENAF